MSEFFEPGGETDPAEARSMFEVARNAVFYRDLETASETFNMIEALQLILDSIENGTELDHERLSRLTATFIDDEPQLDSEYDEDGFLVYFDEEGKEVRREAPSPHLAEYFAREKARRHITAAYIETAAPDYITDILSKLDVPAATEGRISVLIERGRKEDEVISRNELEQAAFGYVGKELKARGYIVRQDNQSVGADGSPDHPKAERTHTLRTLIVTRNPEFMKNET